jgi:hypothetical protein
MIFDSASVLGRRLGYLPNAHPIFAGGAQHVGFLFGHDTQTWLHRFSTKRQVATLSSRGGGLRRCIAANGQQRPVRGLRLNPKCDQNPEPQSE